MKYSLSEIMASYPPGKWEPLWTRLVLRPISYPGAWLAVRLGLSANQVTLCSVFVVLVAGLLMGMGSKNIAVLGAVLFNIYALMDCVDGHVARVKQEASKYGGWLDAFGGYTAYTCVLLSVGNAAQHLEQAAQLMPGGLNFIILGSLGAAANLLIRAEYQNYKNLKGEEAANQVRIQKKFGANLGITGFLMPAVLVCVITGTLHWLILLYSGFYLCAWFFVSFRLIKFVQKLQDDFMKQKRCSLD